MFQPFLDFFPIILEFFKVNFIIFQWLGIFILLIILIKAFKATLLFYNQSVFKQGIEWTFLEIKIPREVQRTPMAMEQFFVNIHALKNAPGNFFEKYIDGEVPMWWSLEITSFGGEVHFYIRTPKKHKKIVESGLYAQYPYIEISEVRDYMDAFPKETSEIYQKGGDIFGGEFILTKDDFYPITTYEYFEKVKGELAFDPISTLLEVLSNIGKEETVFIQILIRPVGSEWHQAGKKFIAELSSGKKKKKSGNSLINIVRNILMAPVQIPEWGEKSEDKKGEDSANKLTSEEKKIIEVIDEKISKPSFDIIIRYIYSAPNSIFSANFISKGILGAINQYSSQSLNSFKGNAMSETRGRWIYFPYFFIKQKIEVRKQRILYNYRNRKMPEELKLGEIYASHYLDSNVKSKSFVLNVAELATIYHVPAEEVLTAPHTKRAESKTIGPPAGLPIFAEE